MKFLEQFRILITITLLSEYIYLGNIYNVKIKVKVKVKVKAGKQV